MVPHAATHSPQQSISLQEENAIPGPELKKNADFLKERVWTKKTNCPLKKFANQHQTAHHTTVLCSKHVSF